MFYARVRQAEDICGITVAEALVVDQLVDHAIAQFGEGLSQFFDLLSEFSQLSDGAENGRWEWKLFCEFCGLSGAVSDP